MTITADCLNSRSLQGRNATPLPVMEAVKKVFGGTIELDVASDEVINEEVGADRILTFADDSFQREWKAETAFMNPPGTTVTGGTYTDRYYWLHELQKAPQQRGEKPEEVSVVTAAKWYRKLYHHWLQGDIDHAICLVYRGGSLGSLGKNMLDDSMICMTCADVESKVINGSGRLSFEIINDNNERISETSNTQCSHILLLTHSGSVRCDFEEVFSQFGSVK